MDLTTAERNPKTICHMCTVTKKIIIQIKAVNSQWKMWLVLSVGLLLIGVNISIAKIKSKFKLNLLTQISVGRKSLTVTDLSRSVAETNVHHSPAQWRKWPITCRLIFFKPAYILETAPWRFLALLQFKRNELNCNYYSVHMNKYMQWISIIPQRGKCSDPVSTYREETRRKLNHT